ncbi:MAG TPA: 30S ribosomal protein S2 [Candidatus Nanoarchaeia archaeon]|nr:30S ribosomal protein S2 [Candidatus Nanoarchaeia archaeon]
MPKKKAESSEAEKEAVEDKENAAGKAEEKPKRGRKKKEEKPAEKAEEKIEGKIKSEAKDSGEVFDVFASDAAAVPVPEAAEKEKKKITREELLERAKKIKVEEISTEELKEKVTGRAEMLVPIEDYVKYGIHLGTKVITPVMRRYVYKRRADGLAVLNTNLIDKKLRESIDFLAKFKPDEVLVVCKRMAGWNAVSLFSELTGIKAFTKKYPAGILTNLNLSNFMEPELVVVCDPWVDKNAMNDAKRMNKNVLSLCDSNNIAKDVEHIIPCNNKSNKSIGLVFHILAREYCKKHKIEKEIPPIEQFVGEDVL